jgi:hypothetical protein
MSIEEQRIKEETEILKKIRREIVKSAKKGDFHYYWDITGLRDSMVKSIITILEEDGKFITNKGSNYKIIRW